MTLPVPEGESPAKGAEATLPLLRTEAVARPLEALEAQILKEANRPMPIMLNIHIGLPLLQVQVIEVVRHRHNIENQVRFILFLRFFRLHI